MREGCRRALSETLPDDVVPVFLGTVVWRRFAKRPRKISDELRCAALLYRAELEYDLDGDPVLYQARSNSRADTCKY